VSAKEILTEYYSKQDRKKMSKRAREFLDIWISSMTSEIDRWCQMYLSDILTPDYSFDSLEALEREILGCYQTLDEFDLDRTSDFLIGASRYYGETVVRNTPGRWFYADIPGREDNLNRIPMIFPNTPRKYLHRVVPLHALKLLVKDREAGLLADTALIIQDAFDEAASDGRAWPSNLPKP
jgi:hypothetical protein